MTGFVPHVSHGFKEIADELDQHGDGENTKEGRHLIFDEHTHAAGLSDLKIRDWAVDDRGFAIEADAQDDPDRAHPKYNRAKRVYKPTFGAPKPSIKNVYTNMSVFKQRKRRGKEEESRIPVPDKIAHQALVHS